MSLVIFFFVHIYLLEFFRTNQKLNFVTNQKQINQKKMNFTFKSNCVKFYSDGRKKGLRVGVYSKPTQVHRYLQRAYKFLFLYTYVDTLALRPAFGAPIQTFSIYVSTPFLKSLQADSSNGSTLPLPPPNIRQLNLHQLSSLVLKTKPEKFSPDRTRIIIVYSEYD